MSGRVDKVEDGYGQAEELKEREFSQQQEA